MFRLLLVCRPVVNGCGTWIAPVVDMPGINRHPHAPSCGIAKTGPPARRLKTRVATWLLQITPYLVGTACGRTDKGQACVTHACTTIRRCPTAALPYARLTVRAAKD